VKLGAKYLAPHLGPRSLDPARDGLAGTLTRGSLVLSLPKGQALSPPQVRLWRNHLK